MSHSTNNSGGIDPNIWGAAGWKFIRSVVIGWDFENQDPKKLCDFVKVLPHVLPCAKCRHNFEDVIQKYPVEPYIARKELPKWYNEVREMVRQHESPKQLNHPQVNEERQYGNLFGGRITDDSDLIHIPDHVRNSKKNKKMFLIILACFAIGGGCLYFLFKKRNQKRINSNPFSVNPSLQNNDNNKNQPIYI